MTLRLDENDAADLRAYAARHGISMQAAAVEAVRRLTHEERRDAIISRILTDDAELLHRLAQ